MRLTWAEPLLSRAGAAIVRAVAATWRYRIRGWEYVERARAAHRPIVYVLWHSRMLPLIHSRRNEGITLLISRHRDGGYLADLCGQWGYRIVRGSSKRGGAVGLLGLIRLLRAGQEVGTTPDGPQGPAERMKPGLVVAAQHAGAVLIAMGARTNSAWWFQSWDRFCIPKPFATIDVEYAPALDVAPGKDGIRQGTAAIERALNQVTYGHSPEPLAAPVTAEKHGRVGGARP